MISKKLRKYVELIKNMPVCELACYSKCDIWDKYRNTDQGLSEILNRFSDGKGFIVISRNDLFELAKKKNCEFIYATFIWGFPNGGRGRFEKIIEIKSDIEKKLCEMPSNISDQDWINHCKWAKPKKGLGIATYSKLLYFMQISINKNKALILDSLLLHLLQKQALKPI